MPKKNRWKSYSASHCGHHRSSNQDHQFSSDEDALWCVADGMGGHANGKKAAVAVCDSMDAVSHDRNQQALLGDRLARISDALSAANRQYWRSSQSRSETSGSAFVTLAASGPLWLCCWAGDSRLYAWNNGNLQPLTRDHRADTANAISRAFGVSATLPMDFNFGMSEATQRFLLCSDGLTDAVNDHEIAAILEPQQPLKPTTERLLAAALAAGGRDNITVSLCEYS